MTEECWASQICNSCVIKMWCPSSPSLSHWRMLARCHKYINIRLIKRDAVHCTSLFSTPSSLGSIPGVTCPSPSLKKKKANTYTSFHPSIHHLTLPLDTHTRMHPPTKRFPALPPPLLYAHEINHVCKIKQIQKENLLKKKKKKKKKKTFSFQTLLLLPPPH